VEDLAQLCRGQARADDRAVKAAAQFPDASPCRFGPGWLGGSHLKLTNEQARWRKRFPRRQRHMDAWQSCGHTSLYSDRYIEYGRVALNNYIAQLLLLAMKREQ
jgi:hypothetical protein